MRRYDEIIEVLRWIWALAICFVVAGIGFYPFAERGSATTSGTSRMPGRAQDERATRSLIAATKESSSRFGAGSNLNGGAATGA